MNFRDQCYALLVQVPKGKVTTYQAIAHALSSKAYRAVGTAMAKNPNPITVPCHRVVKSSGEVGNYAFGIDKKIALLEQEGIEIKNGKIVNFADVFYDFL
ncbi:MAG: MGMT family protein [Campylobacterales bacterium]|nr:MGMT family protein [Campylobacterales bacterium]